MNFWARKINAARLRPPQQSDIKPLTQKESGALHKQWSAATAPLMRYDGEPNWYMEINTNVRDDILLRTAIDEIKEEYFRLINRNYNIRKMHINGKPWRTADEPFLHAYNAALDEIKKQSDSALIMHNARSLDRLMQKDYGFGPKQKAELLEAATPREHELYQIMQKYQAEKMPREHAKKIVGKIIGHALQSYKKLSKVSADLEPYVTNSFSPSGNSLIY